MLYHYPSSRTLYIENMNAGYIETSVTGVPEAVMRVSIRCVTSGSGNVRSDMRGLLKTRTSRVRLLRSTSDGQ